MKRKSSDFTTLFYIQIIESEANGKFWSKLWKFGGMDVVVWEQEENSKTRAEALAAAEYELDRMTEKWLDEGEPEEPYEDDRKNGAPESQFLYKRP